MTHLPHLVRYLLLPVLAVLGDLLIPIPAARADDAAQLRSDVQRLEHRVQVVESHINDAAEGGAVLYLFGAFCALWAQTTHRNAWLWFFLGFFFSIITVLVLLYKNSRDRRRPGLY